MSDPPLIIDELYAWICIAENGDEGIPAIQMGETMMPLVGADLDRINSVRSVAMQVAENAGLPMKLKRFVLTETIEEH